jgi:nicotinate-nucleotide adenylyltransferase
MGTPRIGVLGGTFDPIHYGHLAIAEAVREALVLHRVFIVPATQQPLKTQQSRATAQQRLEMVRLACASNPAFTPSDIELRRAPPSYTSETLHALQAAETEVVEGNPAWWFILGGDALATFPRWHDPQAILARARLVVVQRPGSTLDMEHLEHQVPGLAARTDMIPFPLLTIASTALRERLAAGQTVRYLLPDAVINYIQTHRLYLPDQSDQASHPDTTGAGV